MSDTPRTDALLDLVILPGDIHTHADNLTFLARDLERENGHMYNIITTMSKQASVAEKEIFRHAEAERQAIQRAETAERQLAEAQTNAAQQVSRPIEAESDRVNPAAAAPHEIQAMLAASGEK